MEGDMPEDEEQENPPQLPDEEGDGGEDDEEKKEDLPEVDGEGDDEEGEEKGAEPEGAPEPEIENDDQSAIEAPPALEEDKGAEEEKGEKDTERPEEHSQAQDDASDMQKEDGGNVGMDDDKEQCDEKKEQTAEDDNAENKEEKNESNLNQANADQSTTGEESEWQPTNEAQHSDKPPPPSEQKKPKKPEHNPYEQSVVESAEKWQERLELVEQESKDADETDKPEKTEEDQNAEEEISGTVETVQDENDADTQMLLPTDEKLSEEQQPRLPEDDDEEEDKEEENKAEEEQKEDDTELKNEEEEKKEENKDKTKSDKRGGKRQIMQQDSMEDELEDKEEEGDEEDKQDQAFDPFKEQDGQEDERELRESFIATNLQKDEEENKHDDDELADEEEVRTLREKLDQALSSASPTVQAYELWEMFKTVTADMSQQLSSHLRIILEPLLATKLRGDYRTGKRINIKKVIPYIASQFRKDKIWLRRTKPNKRKYQVMVAIDDSASMSVNQGGRLALEALTVLCTALNQIEVGELAIMSFGDEVRLLHPFDKPFGDDGGAYAISQFKFSQTVTRWPEFLESTVGVLEQAKSMQGGAATGISHLQLVFVISDARILQDREIVSRWVRKAMSRGQLLVMIVVDACESEDKSILNLKSFSYPNGKLKMVGYLDEFPFNFYVVLRDISAMPEIVADALRQWFELIRSDAD